jgi:hypothetical protein
MSHAAAMRPEPMKLPSHADVVEACYDDIAQWEREHGRPDVVFVRGG